MKKNNRVEQLNRLNNLVALCKKLAPRGKDGSNAAEFGRIVGVDPSQIRIYLNPEKKGGRWMGERFARFLEEETGLESYWMDKSHNEINDTNEIQLFTPMNLMVVNIPHMKWNAYCSQPDSIIKNKELKEMVIKKSMKLSENIYGLQIDTDSFSGFTRGMQIIVDPDMAVKKDDIIVISFSDRYKTLAKYKPGMGSIQVEPLEQGMPHSKLLDNEEHTIHGIVVIKGNWDILI